MVYLSGKNRSCMGAETVSHYSLHSAYSICRDWLYGQLHGRRSVTTLH